MFRDESKDACEFCVVDLHSVFLDLVLLFIIKHPIYYFVILSLRLILKLLQLVSDSGILNERGEEGLCTGH